MGEPVLPDDLLKEIFTRTDPKTAARCRTASTTWRIRLSSNRFRRDNTLANIGKHRKVLLQIGDPETYGSNESFCIVDCYSTTGPDLRLLLWNPLLRVARELDDPADKLLKQAVIGYAFGYRAGTDNYCVVHMSKRHVLDRFLHCNVFNSADGCWKHAYINDQRLTHLDEGSAFHLGKAVWVNWGGRGLIIATHVVVLDAETFLLSKIRINRRSLQHVQAMRVLDGIPHLVGYERSPYGGLSTIWCKIDLESMCVVPIIKLGVVGQYGVPWNPVTIMGDHMITVRENNRKRAGGANGAFLTEISLDQINVVSRRRVTTFKGEWPRDMSLHRVIIVGVGCLVP
ncbi:hypothetical protein S83_016350 [Arachis hypogaea]